MPDDDVGRSPEQIRHRTIPVAEIFGPTLQGEGPLAGTPAYFIRFGGCDSKCSWCDSPHAVLPVAVRQLPRMTEVEIAARLAELPVGPQWVVLTGGNPLLFQLSGLVTYLQELGYQIQVETQGTVYHGWLDKCEMLVVSPKPPSSGMQQDPRLLTGILARDPFVQLALKVVIFTEEDLTYAQTVHRLYPQVPFYLSVGNVPEKAVAWPDTQIFYHLHPLEAAHRGNLVAFEPFATRPWADNSESRAARFRWLAERVAGIPGLSDARVLPQLHVVAWGNERGH